MRLGNIKLRPATIQHVLRAFGLYLGTSALDILTSLHFPPGIQEGNPFARHADGSFWLKHALITDGINTLEAFIVSLGCFMGARIFGKRVALFAAGLPWLYLGWMHLDAAFNNIFIEIPHLYQETASDAIRHLLGAN
jgi:hypothetical protein